MNATAKDWRTLPAGEDLDEVVAVRVLGWEVRTFTERSVNPDWFYAFPRNANIPRWTPAVEVQRVVAPGTPEGEYGPALPPLSTDIAAAWPVVESMEARGLRLDLRTPFMPGEPHFAGFTPHGVTGWNGRPDHEQHADTPALAIVRAALAATEAR